MKHARRNMNMVLHAIAFAMLVFGFVMAVKAAGLADLDGDFNEMVRSIECGIVAILGGAFLWTWNV